MRLTDVMSGAGLADYAIVALIIFCAAFLAITLRLLFSRSATMKRAALLPFDEGPGSDGDASND
jgi:hypothetical protein